jgi:uncharacterized membrane protein YeaQ/YmgE (transglycosylase-associated protein family)
MHPAYGILLWIIIGAVAGWLASLIMRTRQGIAMDVVVGVVGALIGGFVTRVLFGYSAGNRGLLASFGVALLGAVVLLGVLKALAGAGRGGGGRPIPH